MKIIIFFLLVTAILMQNAEAQTVSRDSAGIVEKAQRDAARFRLKSTDLKIFITEHWRVGSDHFKPVLTRASRAFLNDSLYVAAYRAAAFNNAAHERQLLSRHESLLTGGDTGARASPVSNPDRGRLARQDVEKFKLSSDLLKRSKAEHFPITSDYFNPTTQTTANANLLSDSIYVRDFREEAYYKSFNTRVHPIGHIALITTLGAIGVTGIMVIGLVFARHSH